MMLKFLSILGGKSKSADKKKDHNPLEDVQRLYEVLDIDPATYRRFENPPLPLSQISKPKPVAEPAQEETSPSEQSSVDQAGGSPEEFAVPPSTSLVDHHAEAESAGAAVAAPAEPEASRTPATTKPADEGLPVPRQESVAPRFSLLSQFAFDTLHSASETAPVVGFASFLGGVGKSTLTAALATSLFARNQRCLVLAETEYSPLPYYLGWTKHELSETPCEIMHLNLPIESGKEDLNLFIGGAHAIDLVAEARSKVARADLLLLDLEASQGFGKEMAAVDLLIIPIRPDVNALIIIERIDQTLAELDEKPELGVFFVLNQFDDEKLLHREIMQTMKQRLKGRLLDIVIPLDETVQLALASGKPPQTLDTNSPFAQAVNQLSAWLEGAASLPSRA